MTFRLPVITTAIQKKMSPSFARQTERGIFCGVQTIRSSVFNGEQTAICPRRVMTLRKMSLNKKRSRQLLNAPTSFFCQQTEISKQIQSAIFPHLRYFQKFALSRLCFWQPLFRVR